MSGRVYQSDGVYPMEGGTTAAGGGIAVSLDGNTAGALALVSSGTFILAGGNNITVSQNGQSVTISGAAGGGAGDGGNILAAGTRTAGSNSSVLFSNLNGISFGLDTVNGSVMTASYTVPSQSVQTQNFVAVIGSGANGNGTFTSGTLSLKAGNNITLSTGANVISVHGVAAQTVQSQNFIAAIVSGANGDGTYTSGTLSVKAGNNITLSTGANVFSIHGVAAQTVQTQNFVAVIGSGANGNGTFTSGTLTLAAGNNVTLSTGVNVISIHGGAGGGGGGIGEEVRGANGTATFTSGTITVAAGNNITLSTGANAWSIHGVAAQTVQTQNFVAVVGNGANGTGTFSSGSVSLAAGNNITLSTGANIVSIHGVASAPAQQTLSGYHPYDEGVQVAGQVGQGSLHMQPLQIPIVQYDRVGFSINWTNATNSSGSATISQWVGLYTKNASTLSLDISTSTSVGITFAGTGGNQSLQAGPRLLTVPWTQTLTKGNYWVAILTRTTSGNTDGSFSQYLLSDIASAYSGIFGAASNATAQRRLGLGVYTATTNAIPGSIAFSQLNGTATGVGRQPIFLFGSGTA